MIGLFNTSIVDDIVTCGRSIVDDFVKFHDIVCEIVMCGRALTVSQCGRCSLIAKVCSSPASKSTNPKVKFAGISKVVEFDGKAI